MMSYFLFLTIVLLERHDDCFAEVLRRCLSGLASSACSSQPGSTCEEVQMLKLTCQAMIVFVEALQDGSSHLALHSWDEGHCRTYFQTV